MTTKKQKSKKRAKVSTIGTQRALRESAAQIKRGEVSSLAALRAIYRRR